jgi:hypothetical protein
LRFKPAGKIERVATSLSTAPPEDLGANLALLAGVIDPAPRNSGETFLGNLDSITIQHICDTAEKSHVLEDETVGVLLVMRII